MRARYVILRVLLEAGEGLVTLTQSIGSDGKLDIEIALDRSKILSVGRPAIGKFLLALQVNKSLGDLSAGTELFEKYSAVPDDMAACREIVMQRKEPRKLLVQPHIFAESDGTISLTQFEPSKIGMVESFKARYPASDDELFALYMKDIAHVAD